MHIFHHIVLFQPTPPWKTQAVAATNNFPIPPRNATSFEWNNASNPPNQTNLRQNSGLGNAPDYRPGTLANYSDMGGGGGGGDFNRSGSSVYNSSSVNSEPSLGYVSQRGNMSGGYNNDSFNSNINNSSISQDRIAPAVVDNNFDRGNYDNRARNFDNRNDSFDRGNNYDTSRGNDYGNNSLNESSPLMSWKPQQNDNPRNSPVDNRNSTSLNNSYNSNSNWRQDRPRSPEKNDQVTFLDWLDNSFCHSMLF